MKVAVCISHVPDTAAKINVSTDGKSIEKIGLAFVMNPYDEFAVEESLRLKEKFGGEVIAISLGDETSKETLRKALAMGVDKAVLLKDDPANWDSYSVARALADYLKEISPDVIFFGKQSVDFDSSGVGMMVAEMIGLPSVSVITKLEIKDGVVIAEREIEGGKEKVETKLPAVFTAQKGLNEPRYPTLKGIMAAKSKPIEERTLQKYTATVEILKMRRPQAKSRGKIVGTDASAVVELVNLLHNEAKVI